MTENSIKDLFYQAFRYHPTGVAILAADVDGDPVALTVSSLISVCSEPPTVAMSLSTSSSSSSAILSAPTFVVHMLSRSNKNLAILGATPGANRFGSEIPWERLPSGEPRYKDVKTWFRAKINGALPTPGATLVTAELIDGSIDGDSMEPGEDALVYHNRGWHSLK